MFVIGAFFMVKSSAKLNLYLAGVTDMLSCFVNENSTAIVIKVLLTEQFNGWLESQPDTTKNWLKSLDYTGKADTFCSIPNAQGQLSEVIFSIKTHDDFWSFGALPLALPFGIYQLETLMDAEQFNRAAIAWGLGSYQFSRYKNPTKKPSKLFLPASQDVAYIENVVNATYTVRDLINTPTDDLGPAELAQETMKVAKQFNAEVTEIVGENLLKQNYATIYTVGRASPREPRLIDLQWGDANLPKLTLIGKGVCFDSGGLDLKNAAGMEFMKKDMGGAAHVIGLAQMIMQAKLPVRLRVLISAVENVVAGNAYKPGDVIKTRKGLTVEIGNTDAEGRLVMCDAIAEAVTEKPDLLIDFATLTGAARVAVGAEIAALFTNNKELGDRLAFYGAEEQDPIWKLPLYQPYRKMLDSSIADINNAGSSSYGGAITAALFLKEFVPNEIPWAHFDLMAWNLSTTPGKPAGGEAMALRATFAYVKEWLANRN